MDMYIHKQLNVFIDNILLSFILMQMSKFIISKNKISYVHSVVSGSNALKGKLCSALSTEDKHTKQLSLFNSHWAGSKQKSYLWAEIYKISIFRLQFMVQMIKDK